MEIQKIYRSKLILSGSVAELFYFSSGFRFDSFVDDSFRRQFSLNRARVGLSRKINANAGMWFDDVNNKFYRCLFLTLTFAENVKSVEVANKMFNLFIRRYNYQVLGSRRAVLKWVAVVEFQKRGAVHYHLVLFNVPYIRGLKKRTEEAWSYGFAWYETVRNVKNVGAYMTKYMTKSAFDERLRGKKTYFSSRGLYKPLVIVNDFQIADYLSVLPAPSFSREDNSFQYNFYNLSSNPLKYVGFYKLAGLRRR